MVKYWHHIPAAIRKALKILVVVGVVGFVLDLAIIIGISLDHPKVPSSVDAVVVLGAKVGTPALKYRALTGLAYYQEGKTSTLVLSGARGPGEPTTEAAAMERVIQNQVAETHGKTLAIQRHLSQTLKAWSS